MIRVILIDDEPLARTLLRTYLAAYPACTVVAECSDGFEGLKAIGEHAPDLIFLDVQMPKVSGFEMLELLDEPPAVIFTTAFDHYAIQAFEASAVDYLLKPIQPARFNAALGKAVEKIQARAVDASAGGEEADVLPLPGAYMHRIVVKDRGAIRIVPAADIRYIEASDDYLKIFTPTGHFLKKGTLARAEATLDPAQFVRVHRSYLVPVGGIVRIEPYEKDGHLVLLRDGGRVPASKAGMQKLKVVLRW